MYIGTEVMLFKHIEMRAILQVHKNKYLPKIIYITIMHNELMFHLIAYLSLAKNIFLFKIDFAG